jgi:acetylornithine/succinyldiaminopimelate/putrescine aminotransferase
MAPPRLIHAVKHLVPDLVAQSSLGSRVTTECGKRFLDLTCGIGVTNLGYAAFAVRVVCVLTLLLNY